jgi:hypothetical protein
MRKKNSHKERKDHKDFFNQIVKSTEGEGIGDEADKPLDATAFHEPPVFVRVTETQIREPQRQTPPRLCRPRIAKILEQKRAKLEGTKEPSFLCSLRSLWLLFLQSN